MVGATSSRSQGCTDQVALDLDRTNVCMSIKCHPPKLPTDVVRVHVWLSPVLVHSMSDAVLPQQSHSGTE